MFAVLTDISRRKIWISCNADLVITSPDPASYGGNTAIWTVDRAFYVMETPEEVVAEFERIKIQA